MYFTATDELFLFMIVLSGFGAILSLRNINTRQTMYRLFRRPIAISSAIILAVFLSIAVLDSVRFVESTAKGDYSEPHSLLDRILAPLDSIYEKTYAAPMQLQLFVTEMRWHDGKVQQYHPRVRYSLVFKNDIEKWRFIKIRTGQAFIYSALLTLLIYIILKFYSWQLGRKSIQNSRLLATLLTFFLSVFFILLSYKLSRHLHVLGTGKIGQDIFYQTIKSIRTGLVIGSLTTLVMLPFAILLGIMAGYFGGFIDDAIQFTYTVLSSIPGILLITASVLSLQTFIANHPHLFPTLAQSADARLLALCIILGVTSWTSLCRLLRAEVLKYREIDFVLASKAMGSSIWRIISRHLLPNMMPIVLITVVLDFSFLVLAEAVLSYVGVGVSPLTISWGNMINSARLELARDPVVWWPILAAFLLMFLLVLALNLFADAVRDALDPHGNYY